MRSYTVQCCGSSVDRMSVDFDKFRIWAEQHFDGDITIKGREIKINSIFVDEDVKHHMWCSPSGGKKQDDRPDGVYHCWKTSRKGTLVSLVSRIEGIPYEEAKMLLEPGALSLAELESQIESFLSIRSDDIIPEIVLPPEGIPMPSNTFRIMDLPESDYYRSTAELYLKEVRKLPVTGKFVCCANAVMTDPETGEEMDYSNRLLIPYYDRTGKLIYWNARYLGNSKSALRYLGPPKSIGIGKEDVVYMTEWPELGSKVYLEEGELDADTLKLCQLSSGAFGGKEMHDKQIAMLAGYILVLCLDNDGAGLSGLKKIGDYLLTNGFDELYYIRPPKGYKDWNEFWIAVRNPKLIRAYINHNITKYGPWVSDTLNFEEVADFVCGSKKIKGTWDDVKIKKA